MNDQEQTQIRPMRRSHLGGAQKRPRAGTDPAYALRASDSGSRILSTNSSSSAAMSIVPP